MTATDRSAFPFDAWLALLKVKLPDLGYAKSLAFAASCCERSVPNYNVFSREAQWGEPKVLAEALDLIWRVVTAKNPADFDSYGKALREALEPITPDTEQYFESLLTSAALDAACSLGRLSTTCGTKASIALCRYPPTRGILSTSSLDFGMTPTSPARTETIGSRTILLSLPNFVSSKRT